MTIEELESQVNSNLSFVDKELDESKSPDAEDIDGIVGYGMKLAAIISLTAKTLADATELLRKKELIYMQSNENLWERPSVLKKMMEGALAGYYSKVIFADRLNAAITHKMDFYRSVLSKHKEELRTQIQFRQ